MQRLYIVLKQDPGSGKEGAKKETKKDDGHPDTSKSSSDSVASEEGGRGIQVKNIAFFPILIEDYIEIGFFFFFFFLFLGVAGRK